MRHQLSPWVGSLIAAAVLVLAVPASAQTPPPSKPSPWSFEVTPYLWAAGLHGDFEARGRSASVDPSFSDLLKNLDFGLSMFSELRYDRWALLLDGQYLKLSSDADTPGPAFSKVEVTSQTGILGPSLAYRPLWTKHFTLDVLAGIRAWWVDTELELKPGQLPGVTVDQSKSWVDPIIGVRFGWQFADNWFLRAVGDVGGFGAGSDLTWQAFAGVGYQFHRHWSVTAGYRALAVDFDKSGFELDVIMHGPVVGVGFRF
jgi:Outer membrane protein beta-barrel domain